MVSRVGKEEGKQDLRERVWRTLQSAGAARFPGVKGRIPNFVGAEAAASGLEASPEFRAAQTLKCNPDSPQRPVRHRALKAGKVVYVAVPRLRDPAPFLKLDPRKIGAEKLWEASSIKGADLHGVPTRVAKMPKIDLIVTGCVAVSRDGARLGKGGGYSDLEYAFLREADLVDENTTVATTLHAVQLLRRGAVPVEPHDISLDLVALPSKLVRIRDRRCRPDGVLWDRLDTERLEAIPALWRRKRSR